MIKMKKILTILTIIQREVRRILTGKKYFVALDITDKCNLRCEHCYAQYSYIDKNNPQWEPISTWKNRFQRFKREGVIGLLIVGGEPALRLDIIELADKFFPIVGIITNGTIKIPESFRHYIYLSLDGLRQTNDRIRGDGVFDRVLDNYRGDNRVIVNITIMKQNYLELEDLIKVAKDAGFHGVVCNIYTPVEGSDPGKNIDSQERKMILNELRRIKRLYPDYFLLNNQMLEWYEHPDHSDFCKWGDHIMHYDAYMNERRCFAASDCKNCGCYAGAVSSILNLKNLLLHPRETFRIVRKL